MRSVLLFLLAVGWTQALAAVTTPVFVLHAYSQEYPWTRGQHQGFVDTLNADPRRAYDFSVEYLDTKRAGYHPAYAAEVAEHLRLKYRGYRPEAIYVTDDNALAFARTHLDKLFPGVPVFFSGVNDVDVREKIDPEHITGVLEVKEILPNLRLMRQIDPAIRDIVFVGDESETYRVIENEILQALLGESGIQATFISASRIEDLVERLRERRERFVFLTTLGAITGQDGRTLSLPETVAAIVGAGNFVVFSMEDAYLYPGVLGGYVTRGQLQGRAAAELLMRHLDGTPLDALPVIERSPNAYVIDETELHKAGLVLPADIARQVSFVNRLPTFYASNRTIILGTLYALLALLLVSLATSLLLFVRKNRQIARASRQLAETRTAWSARRTSRRSATGTGMSPGTGCSGRMASTGCSDSILTDFRRATRPSWNACIPRTVPRSRRRSARRWRQGARTRSIIASCARMAKSGSCTKARKWCAMHKAG